MFSDFPVNIVIDRISNDEVIELVNKAGKENVTAVINRKNVAQDVSNLLDIPINMSKKKISLEKSYFTPDSKDGDTVIIARQIPSTEKVDDRLIIPKRPRIEFFIVDILDFL